MIRSLFAALAILTLLNHPAHAALDPGVESMVLQAVSGTVAAAILAVRGGIDRLIAPFRLRGLGKGIRPPASSGTRPGNDPGDGESR